MKSDKVELSGECLVWISGASSIVNAGTLAISQWFGLVAADAHTPVNIPLSCSLQTSNGNW